MKLKLRQRYAFWLMLMMVALVGLQFMAFAVYEFSEIGSWKNTEEVEEEVGEIVVLLVVDAIILPLVLLISWIISGRMLQPLHAVATTARRVSAGQLQERVTAPIPDDEMAALVQTVNQAFDKYHAVLRRLEQFTSDASHQLRTPLAALRMLGEVSLQKNRSPEAYRETLGAMLEEVARLSEIVDKLLLLARLEPAQIQERFSAVVVHRLVAETVESCALLAADQEIRLSADCAPDLRVNGDHGLLRQALSNLLNNALAHTPAQGSIAVQATLTPDRAVEIAVRDTGPGVPPDYRERIFERFVRVPGTSVPGTGLGLAIVHDIAQVHGGSVRLEPASGPGATFVLRLPAA